MKRVTGNIYHESCDNVYTKNINFMPPTQFKKKLTKCVFRGSATGCGITTDTNMRLKAALLSYEWEKSSELLIQMEKMYLMLNLLVLIKNLKCIMVH